MMLIVFNSFSTSYFFLGAVFSPLSSLLVHFYAAVFSTWTILFVIQSGLVSAGNRRLHREVGVFGALVAGIMLVLGVLDLGVEPDGRVCAVWYDSRSADWRWRVMTAVVGTDGTRSAGNLITSPGNNTWPATSGGVIAMASTRNALRMQRDHTQQIFLAMPPPPPSAAAQRTAARPAH